MQATLKLAAGSIALGAAVLALKTLAWWLTGSVALLSDALESTVNLVAAVAALAAIRVAARPADARHPFGHHKAEYFSAVLEGVMIIVAALLILRAAYFSFVNEHPIDAPMIGLVINGVATGLNAVWAVVLVRQGRVLRSPALLADGRHLWTDVLSSAGIFVGLALALATGWLFLDPLIAAIVAVHILWSGSKVVRESLSGLLDEAAPQETVDAIGEIIAREAGGAVQAHDLRTRHAGAVTFMEFHLVVPGDMTVFDAHEICDRVEAAIGEAIEGARVTIHLEPEHKSKRKAIIVGDEGHNASIKKNPARGSAG